MGTIVSGELTQDGSHVVLDRLIAYLQGVGYLFVRVTSDDVR